LAWLSWLGIGAILLMLAYEHSLVKAGDLSRVNAAFFTVNGYVSVLFFLFWAADIYFLRPKGVF
jgi:4-hydroxybenzoate polyprenyltransferase